MKTTKNIKKTIIIRELTNGNGKGDLCIIVLNAGPLDLEDKALMLYYAPKTNRRLFGYYEYPDQLLLNSKPAIKNVAFHNLVQDFLDLRCEDKTILKVLTTKPKTKKV